MGLNQPIPLSLYQDTKAMIKKKESAGSNLLYRESSSWHIMVYQLTTVDGYTLLSSWSSHSSTPLLWFALSLEAQLLALQRKKLIILFAISIIVCTLLKFSDHVHAQQLIVQWTLAVHSPSGLSGHYRVIAYMLNLWVSKNFPLPITEMLYSPSHFGRKLIVHKLFPVYFTVQGTFACWCWLVR